MNLLFGVPALAGPGRLEGRTPCRQRDPDGFMVRMRGRKAEGALHDQTHLRPLPAGERAIVRAVSVPLLGGVRGGSWTQCSLKQPVEAPRLGVHSTRAGIRSCCGWSFGPYVFSVGSGSLFFRR